MLELLSSPEAWLALLTLTTVEVVLGIDNVVFIAILADRRPGDLLSVRVERRGSDPFEAEVELIAVPDDPDRTIVGFIPFDTRPTDRRSTRCRCRL